MAFCEQCGTPLLESALFCAGCGKEIASSAASRAMALDAARSTPGSSRASTADDFAELPEKWRQRFATIEKAGGERVRWWRWPAAKQLSTKEKRLITSNLWAFVFGPFYYLYLGLWRKAITLSLVALVLDVILSMAGDALNIPIDNFLWIVSAIMFKQCANVDYYRKTVLKRREWW
ncbi:DUF2628 domain-containing protein [Paraburkholderia pallida]|uniref:DUF2628 domain-containing protein n=1 Tax=Paraburkholderia pallida TaxID=2547399 RepID=A0A4P7CSF4_9BURK|nr:DUF2628 domain-containing protein [Paraburkholderia pallida]QBQ96919.1 DUF2628 domain-containing protein [Paraburkholderia pallida]